MAATTRETRDRLMAATRSPERLHQRVREMTRPALGGCWEWIGPLSHLGYGRFNIGRDKHPAHRVAYELYVGLVPEGLELDHLCRNRACVNPTHLEPVTRAENVRRSEHANIVTNRTGVCQRGHDMSDYVITNPKTGARACRQCRNRMSNERRAKLREQRRAHREQGERKAL